MRTNHLRLMAAAGSMLAAGAIALSGIVAAAAAPHAARSGDSGIERFQFMSTSETANNTVIARGVFTAGGVDIQTGTNTDTLKFRDGTIKLRHSNPTGPQSFNPRTCLGTVNQHGTYTLLGGTGKYAGISGHGTFRLHVLIVAARAHGKCSDTEPPVAFELLIRAAGPAEL